MREASLTKAYWTRLGVLASGGRGHIRRWWREIREKNFRAMRLAAAGIEALRATHHINGGFAPWRDALCFPLVPYESRANLSAPVEAPRA